MTTRAPPPEHARALPAERRRRVVAGVCVLVWLASWLIFLATLSDFIDEKQSVLFGTGRYSPKLTSLFCIMLALVPMKLAEKATEAFLLRRPEKAP